MENNPATKKHPDTAQGAAAALRENSDLDTAGAVWTADPAVRGVWGFSLADGTEGIVYLAGYPTPWGETRTFNDFESSDFESEGDLYKYWRP